MEQRREALHEPGFGRRAKQDGTVHLFPGRELIKARHEALGRDRHGDRAGAVFPSVGRAGVIWHACAIPDHGCSTVSGGEPAATILLTDEFLTLGGTFL
ncbi:MAG: hypothetical protein JO189_33325 [Deltaproteobacteria bacterium]|nr:hypothetical protein [Deltaproteobacteria bacterium]